MEKSIKYASVISIITAIIFFIFMLEGARANAMENTTGVLYKIVLNGANILLYVTPIAFIITFSLGMICIFKRFLIARDRSVGKKVTGKFPMVLFLIAMVLFILFIAFITAIMTA